MTTRFFLDRVDGDLVTLGKEDSHHLLRVMRSGIGDSFTVLAGGLRYECSLESVTDGRAIGRVQSAAEATGEPPVRITLFQGLAKGEKMDLVVQHGTEVGVTEFVPVATGRSVVKLEPRKAEERRERWQRIAREAAEQCRRAAVPRVSPLLAWKQAVARCGEFDLALVPWEEGGASLRAALDAHPAARSFALFIGPEGGLAPEEVALAREAGAVPVTLGPRILRTETAPLVAASIILFTQGDLG